MISILLTLYWTFLKIGLFSIGGGYAMIPLMEAELITIHGWMSASEFLDVMAIAEATPGPVSVNAATFAGYRLAGVVGSLTATLGIITPSLVLLIMLSRLLIRVIQNPRAENFLNGLRSALVALILLASFSLGRSAILDLTTALIFGGLLAFSIWKSISPLFFIIAGAVLGLLLFPY